MRSLFYGSFPPIRIAVPKELHVLIMPLSLVVLLDHIAEYLFVQQQQVSVVCCYYWCISLLLVICCSCFCLPLVHCCWATADGFGQWWGIHATTRTKQHSFCCQLLLLLLARRSSRRSSRVAVQQMIRPPIAKVERWKTATPISEEARRKTTPRIPITVRPKMTLPITMEARPKTMPHITVAVQRTAMLHSAMTAQQRTMPCITEVEVVRQKTARFIAKVAR